MAATRPGFSTHFNPRSPRGERLDPCENQHEVSGYISIHAPLAGSDFLSVRMKLNGFGFQSTLPSRGATNKLPMKLVLEKISIHAPLAGSDSYQANAAAHTLYFNPRSPRGERLETKLDSAGANRFQSTLPSRGATTSFSFEGRGIHISIHAPLAGSDSRYRQKCICKFVYIR